MHTFSARKVTQKFDVDGITSPAEVVNRARLSPGRSGEIFSELGLQLVDLADVLSELGVGGTLADAG